MKVLLVNGSSHEHGSTYTALSEAAAELEKCGIEAEIFHVGTTPVPGCSGCRYCKKAGKCCIDDSVNVFAEKAKEADGFIFGSPVHYGAASGEMTSFMDRLFYSAAANLAYKPGASVVCARRAGTTAAIDQLNKYLTINNMLVVGSQYWNMVHGNSGEEVRQDLEGMQVMRTLARNMAWVLKCLEAGKAEGLSHPEEEKPRAHTNFIR